MPSKKNKEKINRYHIENIFIVLIIISLIVAISINQQNIQYLKDDVEEIPKSEEEEIRNKAKAVAWVYIFASIWFLYSAYKDYKEQKNTARFYYIVAAFLLVIASVIRIYNLYNSSVQVEGAEDYAL